MNQSQMPLKPAQSPYYLVDMKYITALLKVTNKWIYQLIKEGKFPEPIKLGRASRWKLIDVEAWIEARIANVKN